MVNSYQAKALPEALQVLAAEKLIPYGGGTDLMVEAEKGARYLFVAQIPEMNQVRVEGEQLYIGAACTFTQLLADTRVPQILKDAIILIAAPAIRNYGTIGGNICNGSPKADSALILFAVEAKLRLMSVRGERILTVMDFYLGRNKTARAEDELLVEIILPKAGLENYYYQKVGARDALAISRIAFAGIVRMQEDKIVYLGTAFGAISDVILHRADLDALFIGKTLAEAQIIKPQYIAAYDEAIQPTRGRVSAEYRKSVCMNLLKDFLSSKGI